MLGRKVNLKKRRKNILQISPLTSKFTKTGYYKRGIFTMSKKVDQDQHAISVLREVTLRRWRDIEGGQNKGKIPIKYCLGVSLRLNKQP